MQNYVNPLEITKGAEIKAIFTSPLKQWLMSINDTVLSDRTFLQSVTTVMAKMKKHLARLDRTSPYNRSGNDDSVSVSFNADLREYEYSLICTDRALQNSGYRFRSNNFTTTLERHGHYAAVFIGAKDSFANGVPKELTLVGHTEFMDSQEYHDMLASKNLGMFIVQFNLRNAKAHNVEDCTLPVSGIVDESKKAAAKKNADVIYYVNTSQRFACVQLLNTVDTVNRVIAVHDIKSLIQHAR